ncbi:MAG: HD domain-containing protein [Clostridia bacterium]|nr:HD domain-containing protein [Clostridia bacterium]
MSRLTDREIEEIYLEYKTPEHVKGHCRAVTHSAMAIASKLNENGFNLDLDLIYCAGIIHDAARIYPEHQVVIADKMDEMGHHDIAAIVRVHMRYNGFSRNINETDMVCLGDRVVKEDKYVGLDERIEYIIDKAGRTKEVEEKLYKKRDENRKFIKYIEDVCHMSLEDIVGEYEDLR